MARGCWLLLYRRTRQTFGQKKEVGVGICWNMLESMLHIDHRILLMMLFNLPSASGRDPLRQNIDSTHRTCDRGHRAQVEAIQISVPKEHESMRMRQQDKKDAIDTSKTKEHQKHNQHLSTSINKNSSSRGCHALIL